MSPLHNDRWMARFTPPAMGRYLYTVRAWVDHLATWKRDIAKKQAAGQDVSGRSAARQAARTGRRAGRHRSSSTNRLTPSKSIASAPASRRGTSCFRARAGKPGQHGTLRDVIARLPYVASMGFDILYHAADSSHRHDRTQGAEQQDRRHEGRSRQPVGHRRGKRRSQVDSSAARHARRLSRARRRRESDKAWRSRSISRSRRARIIRT